MFTFTHLADAFIQNWQWIQAKHYIYILSVCIPWVLNPQPFAPLTRCSTTEPQELSELWEHRNCLSNIISIHFQKKSVTTNILYYAWNLSRMNDKTFNNDHKIFKLFVFLLHEKCSSVQHKIFEMYKQKEWLSFKALVPPKKTFGSQRTTIMINIKIQ